MQFLSAITYSLFYALRDSKTKHFERINPLSVLNIIIFFSDRRALKAHLPHHKNKNAVVNNRGENSLHVLAFQKDAVLLKRVLEQGADPNVRDHEDKTPLHIAAMQGTSKIVKYLLKHGAEVNAQCKDGATPLHYACSRRDNGVINLLLKHPCNVNIFDKYNQTPIVNLMKNPVNKEDILVKLLDAGSSLKHPSSDFKPLHHLAKEKIFIENAIEYMQILIDRGVDVNERDASGLTPLLQVVRHGHEKLLSCLLMNGADANILDNDHKSPLHIAVECNNHEQRNTIVKYIVLSEYLGGTFIASIKQLLTNDPSLKEVYKKLSDEIHELSKIKNPVSYIDIYLANRNTMVEYAKNQNIVEHMDKLCPDTNSVYGNELKLKFRIAIERMEALAAGTECLGKVIDKKLPSACNEKILEFLSTEDIRMLQRLTDSNE